MNKPYKLLTDWPLPEGVSALISQCNGQFDTCAYGSFNLALHVGDDPQNVKANREALLASQPSLKAIQWLNQTHGTDVAMACGAKVTLDADACVSRTLGLAAAILTADCLPALFVNQQGTQVAAAHAGWRGLAHGVLLNTLAHFENPDQVSVYLGPAIGFDAFEVGPEVRSAFAWASDACFKASLKDRLYADLYALAKEQLFRAGVAHIYGGNECTYHQPQYYSYRQTPITGRQVSMIWLNRS